MSFSGHNQVIYNAAFNGCMGGQLAAAGLPVQAPAAIPSTSNATYLAMAAIATAFATALDAVIPQDTTNFSTGASPTVTTPPTTGAITVHQWAQIDLVKSLAYGYWASRSGAQFA